MLYEIFLDAPWSTLDKAKNKSRPHGDDIVSQHKASPLTCCRISCKNCRYNRLWPTRLRVWLFPLPRCQMYTVQSTNPKSNQQTKGKKKQRNKKVKGDKKATNNVGGGEMEKNSKYLCNLCMENHLTHLCPRLAEAQKLLA
jgi:hypothetical protein